MPVSSIVGAGRGLMRARMPDGSGGGGMFPLSVSANQRYLQTAGGQPFLIHGDTPWSLQVQLTAAQMDTYLDDRQAKGFNAVLFNLVEHLFSSQSPAYRDVVGNDPFTGMSFGSVDWDNLAEAYWARVDYAINAALSRGILCMVQPAYLGFGGGSGQAGDQGWDGEVNNASDANLQAYGAALATRYSQANIIWCMGGDYNPPTPAKQWNIATGIRSVRPSAIITAHGNRLTEAYTVWAGQTGFNLNNIYVDHDGVAYSQAAAAYARSGPMPFFFIEGAYGGASPDADVRRQIYHALLSGACGHFYGTYPVWGFGEPVANGGGGAAAALSGSLDLTSTLEAGHALALFSSYAWHLLEPKTDTSLVTTSLGSGTSRICPARASDGSFAMVYTGGSNFTVNMAAFTPSSVRARWFNPTTGAYSTASGSPFANTGTQAFTAPGERVLVLDPA